MLVGKFPNHPHRGVADGGGGSGVLTPALLKIGSFDPPDSRMKWPKSGVFPIFRVLWGRLATMPTIRPPTQKSVATPLLPQRWLRSWMRALRVN